MLIADDDGVTVRVLRHRFERDGLAVETVEDGLDALAVLVAAPPAVALVNVALAGVDGFEVLRRLRAGEAGPPDLPLALMGWSGNDALVVRGFALDADDVVVRPFSLAEVSARIRRLARRARPAR
ncbi:MAG TPA: response regulator [Rubricoccaceae bacterium]